MRYKIDGYIEYKTPYSIYVCANSEEEAQEIYLKQTSMYCPLLDTAVLEKGRATIINIAAHK